ncbi:hypothetical protein BC834DRAFT_946818 [Gloeopeniophorella convolvens]|nr:hypothetical protein BC834DRAFT_946818 [Gloeopeniophorella convolvens]
MEAQQPKQTQAPLPPRPALKLGPPMTLGQFENQQILVALRRMPVPEARDSKEVVARYRKTAAAYKARILNMQAAPQLALQRDPNAPHALADARIKRALLLWRLFPINDLPVEIIANIFRIVAWSSLTSAEGIKTRFQLTWVCQYWRDVAIHDQTLWNTIWFRDAKIAYNRSMLFFQRSGTATLDIRIEDDERSRINPARPMTGDDMDQLMSIITTKATQLRQLIIIVEIWPAVLVFLDKLYSVSRSLRHLMRIEVHRTGRPYHWGGPGYPLSRYQDALTLAGDNTSHVSNICLNGIHLDWDKCALSNLSTLDLRRMPPNVGPSLRRFREMLKSSPYLKKLSLDGAGPVQPSAADMSSYNPVVLPRLESFVLGDMPIPYAVFCAGLFHAPNVRDMTLLNVIGPDHGPILKALTGKFPELIMLSLYSVELSRHSHNLRILTQFFCSIPKVKYLRLAKMQPHMLEVFAADIRLNTRDDIPLQPSAEELEHLVATIPGPVYALPWLECMEVQEVGVTSVITLARKRSECKIPLKKLYIAHHWLAKMSSEEKEQLKQGIQTLDQGVVYITAPMTMTPEENAIWRQIRRDLAAPI